MQNKSRITRTGTESLVKQGRAIAGTIPTGGAGDTGAARNMEWVMRGERM